MGSGFHRSGRWVPLPMYPTDPTDPTDPYSSQTSLIPRILRRNSRVSLAVVLSVNKEQRVRYSRRPRLPFGFRAASVSSAQCPWDLRLIIVRLRVFHACRVGEELSRVSGNGARTLSTEVLAGVNSAMNITAENTHRNNET